MAAKSPHNSLLDAEAIQRAEHLGLQARSIVEGYMAGAHKSPFRATSTGKYSVAAIAITSSNTSRRQTTSPICCSMAASR